MPDLTSPLLTDFYQIAMAYGYFKAGMAEKNACFQLFFRTEPFGGSFAVACGLEQALEYIESFHFDDEEIKYLSTLKDSIGFFLFDADFLNYLRKLRIRCDIEAIPEGNLVFAREPLLRISGPLLQCQLLETPLLNILNFQTLIATKAARICHIAQNASVYDFGLRRAQGFDGALSATRASFIGGIKATSNVLAAKKYDLPVIGTLGHSWVMAFSSESQAFSTYANVMPSNCVFLVDTYDSIEGIKNAILVGKKLREQNHQLLGIRLDSGDLLHLSQKARNMLDESGFFKTQIIVSGDLDEHSIETLRNAKAPIDAFGIGTRLVTAFDEPALNGTYKLVAIQKNNTWRECIKISDTLSKTTLPGMTQVRRYQNDKKFFCDLIYDPSSKPTTPSIVPLDATNSDLLIPVTIKGKRIYQFPTLKEIKKLVKNQLLQLDSNITKLKNPDAYPVLIDKNILVKQKGLMENQT